MFRNFINKDNDIQLAVVMQQGNKQSLGILYDKYAPALFGIITRITNNEKTAENILSLTFVRIENQIAAFNSSFSSLFSWLINIARQTAFEEVKSEQAQNSEAFNNVYCTQHTSAFQWVYYKGFTYSEVASKLQMSVEQVKQSIILTMCSMKEKTVVR